MSKKEVKKIFLEFEFKDVSNLSNEEFVDWWINMGKEIYDAFSPTEKEIELSNGEIDFLGLIDFFENDVKVKGNKYAIKLRTYDEVSKLAFYLGMLLKLKENYEEKLDETDKKIMNQYIDLFLKIFGKKEVKSLDEWIIENEYCKMTVYNVKNEYPAIVIELFGDKKDIF